MSSFSSKFSVTCLIDQPPDTGAPLWASPMQFATTGAGGANGDTIVSDELGGATDSDDDFVGMLAECIDGPTANLGVIRRITSHSEAVGVVTLTVDRFPAQVASGDVFRLIDLTASCPCAAEDTGGSAVQVEDATRSEVDDTWVGSAEEGGPYLETVEADNVTDTQIRLITDSTALGVITVPLGANTAVGDLYDIMCCPEWEAQGFLEFSREDLPREQYQGTFDTPAQAKGRRVVQGTGVLLFRGPGSGRDGERSECARILSSPLDEATTDDLVADAGSAVDSIVYDAGTGVDGQLYCTAEGDCFMGSSAATPMVPLPDLRTAPIDNSTVVSLKTYTVGDAVNHHLAAKQYRGDGVMELALGMVPSLTMSAELNSFLKISVALQGSDWYRTHRDSAGALTRAWRAKRPTVAPLKVAGGRIVLGSTVYRLKSFSLDLGLEYVLAEDFQAPNQCTGYRLTGASPSGQWVGVLDDDSVGILEEHDSGQEQSLLIQVGSRTGFPGVFCFYGHKVQILSVALSDDGGKQVATVAWKICDFDNDTNGLPTAAIGIG